MTPAIRLIYLPLGSYTIIMAQPNGDKSHCMVNLQDSDQRLIEQIEVRTASELAETIIKLQKQIGEP
jgi:hypothetical protein